jgi:Xaa-Pro dipeptidase
VKLEDRKSKKMELQIRESEYKVRIEKVRKALAKRKLDALYITNGANMYYLTGYSFISTERPAALVIPADGKVSFLGPLLERDHVPLETKLIEQVKTYFDYPGEKHPIDCFADFLVEMGLHKKRIGTDSMSGATGMWGYKGEPLSKKLSNTRFVDASDFVASMRIVKSPAEIDLMRESSKWANLACALLHEYVDEGLWDVEIAMQASLDASQIMKKTLGPQYRPMRSLFPVNALFRGQIGEMSAIPHSMSTGKVIRKGNVLIGEIGVDVGGYTCELERTMIFGKPTAKQERYFKAVVKAQQAAFEAFKPGARCSDIDKATANVFKKAGLSVLVKHHTGHGLGLEVHEPPFLDIGNNELLSPGMIVSCEPGIYYPGFGGFRHSDSLLITDEGLEIMTYYPRDLDSLTIE